METKVKAEVVSIRRPEDADDERPIRARDPACLISPTSEAIAMVARNLPAELWLEIFALATLEPLFLASDYRAFQPIQPHRRSTGLNTLRTLCMVCKVWNTLASTMLYKDIQIQYGMPSLLRALKQPAVSIASGTDKETFTNGDTVRQLHLRAKLCMTGVLGQESCPTLQCHR
jgi:F-box-like